jgi:hypothetical protein
MSSAAQFRSLRKAVRDAFQALLAVLAAGGATVAFETFIGTLAPAYSGLLAIALKIVIAYAQNYLETAGRIAVMLPTPGIVPVVPEVEDGNPANGLPMAAPVGGIVEAAVDDAGALVGQVKDTKGAVVGDVIGAVAKPLAKKSRAKKPPAT